MALNAAQNATEAITGIRYGHLVVVADTVRDGRRMICAHCDCGKMVWFPYTQWKYGKPKNCGCRKQWRHDDHVKIWVLYHNEIMSAWRFITTIIKAHTVHTVDELLRSQTKCRIKHMYGIDYAANQNKDVLVKLRSGTDVTE